MKVILSSLALVTLGAALPSQLTFNTPSVDSSLKWLSSIGKLGGAEVARLAAQVAQYEQQPHQILKGASSDPAFSLVALDAVPDHELRIKEVKGLCDTTVKQHSGYLDIKEEGKHFFFWQFESRGNPKKDPLVLWLNGGPGCSSSTGLLFELGPCNVRGGGNGTDFNKYGWNEKANIIFLDQPVAVGFSYADDGGTLNNSKDVGIDVYAFLQLFYSHFPEYAKLPFHIAGESYGGHYVPSIAAYVNEQNKKVRPQAVPKAHHIPLESIMIGNGLTEPLTQFAAFPDFSCKPSKTAIFDEATCDTMRSKVPTCSRLIQFCYDNPSRFTCVPANVYCTQNLEGPIQNVPVNPYNVHLKCDRNGEDGPLCYRQMEWIDTYLNQPDIKKALGAPTELEFVGCNTKVTQAFFFTGDHMHNSAQFLPPLLDDGIRILIYAGELDWICNALGNQRWFRKVLGKEGQGEDEVELTSHKWRNLDTDEVAGEALIGGGGNYTFLKIYEAGHMSPHDQPENTLDMFSRWIEGTPLA